jgi:hypothetical protein
MCSCWYWCKNYKCKHIISVAYRAKDSNKQINFNWLNEHKNIQLGQKRKPGRPALMKKALQYQDNEEYVFSDTDIEEAEPKKTKNKKRKEVEVDDESEPEYDIFAQFDAQPTTSTSTRRTSARLSKQQSTSPPAKKSKANDKTQPKKAKSKKN